MIKYASKIMKSYECSLHPNKEQQDLLRQIFLEAKWYHNWLISTKDIINTPRFHKGDTVTVLNKAGEKITREIQTISCGTLGDYRRQLTNAIRGLYVKKQNGKKIGGLKFKSSIKSLPVRCKFTLDNKYYQPEVQVGTRKKRGAIKIRCYGLDKLPVGCEVVSVILQKVGLTYKIKVNCLTPVNHRATTGKTIGLDFGIKDTLVSSDGHKFKFRLEEREQIRCKKIQKRLSRTVKGSNNRLKLCYKLQKASRRVHSIKLDWVNKVLYKLLQEYDIVVIQDENIAGWKSSWFGKSVNTSVLGMIKQKLKQKQAENKKTHNNTIEIVNRYLPTTAMCPACGTITKQSLSERVFRCACGYTEDRDVHAAKNILKFGIENLVGPVGSEFKSVELMTSDNKDGELLSHICEAENHCREALVRK